MILLAVLAAAAAACAQPTPSDHGGETMTLTACPWLTEGTAADVLGGDIVMSVAGRSDEGTCRFVRRDAAMSFVEIRVSASPLRGCPDGSVPLHAVGNEAQRCRVAATHGIPEEMASGTVRTLHFTVTLAGRSVRSRGKPSEDDDDLARIADEVAGNLY